MILQRQIGSTGLHVSELSLGTASLGNLYRPVSDATASATVQAAIAAGMSYMDTAPHYGHGLSERRVGDALREKNGVILSTKVGRLLRPDRTLKGDGERQGFRSPLPFTRTFGYDREAILRSVDDSLQRLGLATIDILYVHDIGRLTHGKASDFYFNQLTREGGFRALEELRRSGVVRAFGLGVNEWEVCVDAMAHVDLDVILLAGRYTLLEQQSLISLLEPCQDRGVSVVIGGVYNSGILATGTRSDGTLHYNYGNAPPEIVRRVGRIETRCEEFGVSLAAAALQFPLAHPAVASVLVGIGSAARVGQTIDLYRQSIPDAFWQALKSEGLVDASAPTGRVR